MLRILFQWFEFGFDWFEFELECFESLTSSSNLHLNATNPFRCSNLGSNGSNPFRMVRILIWCFESLFNGSDLHSNFYPPFGMVRIWIWMLRIPFKWFEFAFECFVEWIEIAVKYFEYLSNGSNLDSNASNLFRMLRISFEFFEYLSNVSKLDSNAFNPFRIVRICVSMLRIPLEWFEFWFESLSNGSNWCSNSSNLHSNA